ncbi:MAG TPA: bifunctional adenosylcobinamide kinase/adenosylcobinamide-phosphate guanylyltransferase [Deltaproteobacteria bacterium]|nr:bifunctional adenosylcobinamide kinase/adenosylcobinamide-phosphate guanylyltransferase [Deltaproteobacteria bacterium]HQB38221.1 bifunctional adenosylcobinamide kinase/adenosylcobinamide-phosphate guanylyltransferase [Deltaproteobacteria bacterium]
MSKTIFVTGGARSGKSKLAEELTMQFGAPLCYLATAQALDGEMDERIQRHQQRRGENWKTIEEPLHLPQALAGCDGTCKAILVDCITLWVTNLLFLYENQDNTEELILGNVQRLAATLRSMSTPVIMVSNEVGMGIVPDNQLSRLFRDAAGHANQILAAASDDVYTVISGIPLKLKGRD